MKKRTIAAIAVFALVSVAAIAVEPDGYYDAARGKTKGALLSALESCISNHTTIGYKAGLNELYKTSDVRENGTVWDMYSTSSYSFGNACGNYSNVGDCWNKEHSMPKSWFSEGTPMRGRRHPSRRGHGQSCAPRHMSCDAPLPRGQRRPYTVAVALERGLGVVKTCQRICVELILYAKIEEIVEVSNN